MKTGKYITLDSILGDVLKTFNTDDFDPHDAVDDAADALGLLGVYQDLEEDIAKITIEKHRGRLPEGLVFIRGTRRCEDKIAMRYSSDSFHLSYHCDDCPDLVCESDYTYSLNNDYIFTSFEEGTVEMSYAKMPLDSKGRPLIPDNARIKEAIKFFILERIAFRLLLKGKISQFAYQKIEQNKDWYMGSAQSYGNVPSPDQMETLKNIWVRFIRTSKTGTDYFKSIGSQEKFRNHPR